MSSEDERAEKVAQFVGVTGADTDFANSFLEAAEWNLNNALNMYLGGGGEQAANIGTTPTRTVNTSAPPGTREVEGRHERLMERARNIMAQQGVDEVTAMAIAEAQGEPEAQQVRAPIAPQTTRLINENSNAANAMDFQMRAMHDHLRAAMEAPASQGSRNVFSTLPLEHAFRGNINGASFSVDSDEEDYEEDADAADSANLQDLFSPPREIIFTGAWQEAREFGRNTDRWILVNIQKDSEFFSYNLNRDLWCNEIIRELIETSFVFWQQEASGRSAQLYIQYYQPAKYPHVAIIDPFTGEQVLKIDLTRFQTNPDDLLTSFLEKANEFLENHKLEGEKIKRMQANVQKRYAEKEASRARNVVNHAATEETLAAGADHMELDNDVALLEELERLQEEPDAGPDVTVVNFKLFGKKTIRRRFHKTQKVKDLFTFVKHAVEEARTKDFDLVLFPNKSLKESQNETLLEQRLLNTAVSAVYL